MLQYRSFLNTDPPHIVSIWQQLPQLAGQIEQLTTTRCENELFSKPYFDPQGLIIAFADHEGGVRPVGFVHAGFSRSASGADLDYSHGILSVTKAIDCPEADEALGGLLQRGCEYLKTKDAQTVHIGSRFPAAPFYSGLYGGSTVPGVLERDTRSLQAMKNHGFQQTDRIAVWQRNLSGFRPIGGREQLVIRRNYQVNSVFDSVPKDWWETCVHGTGCRERFSIFEKKDQVVCGDISFWEIKSTQSGATSMRGAYELNVPPEFRRSGIATFLLGNAMKGLMQEGIELIEAQTQESDTAANGVFEKLGFEIKYHGVSLSKNL